MIDVEFELGDNCAHICVDVQRMFIEPTSWQTVWMGKVLPAIEAITGQV